MSVIRLGGLCPGVREGEALQKALEWGIVYHTTKHTDCWLLTRALAGMNFRVGQVAPVRGGQPVSHRVRPAPAPASRVVTALHRPVIKLLADALDPAASATVAHGFTRRSKGTSGLSPLALPAALGAPAYLPSPERGWHLLVLDTSVGF